MKVRPAVVDGIFYPSEEAALRQAVRELLDHSPAPPGNAFAIISPHAGFAYAGSYIASAFKAASLRTIITAVVLGPLHSDPLDGIVLPESEAFATPLGLAAVDADFVERLLRCTGNFVKDDIPHLEEHCLEVQLPFIQHLFPSATVVPILLGNASSRTIGALSDALRLTFGGSLEHTLFVASANMASYLRGKDAGEEYRRLAALLRNCDGKGIEESIEAGLVNACGAAVIATVLNLSDGPMEAELLQEGSTFPVDGDAEHVVHYASVAIRQQVSR